MYQFLVKKSVCGAHMTRSRLSCTPRRQLIAIDPWGNGTCVLIAKGSDLQDPELVHGLQPKTVAVECLRLSQPRVVPEGWNQDALKQFARWQTIRTPDGKDLWLKMDTGQTQYTSPFVAEIKPDSSDLC